MDSLTRWQVARALAYLGMLSGGPEESEAIRCLSVTPSQESVLADDFAGLLENLERQTQLAPLRILELVLRDCDILLRGSPHAGFAIGTELTEDSKPAAQEIASARAALLATYWAEVPELRGGLVMVWSANQFVRRWLWWSRQYAHRQIPPGSPGIDTSPAPPLPARDVFPEWATPMVERVYSK
ncbi:hypothetical protein [Streptomyces sp. NBC_00690]|uniref:hypothetical protein n=1 Tax=Streptomyces sp. NBC_00690 TaxID=2975808 RepID=UPI002E29204A|nr:hypothetical protein [Streptomyces sp. NBC_00690]